MPKYLDTEGLAYLWGKIQDGFVPQEEGKGLSSNDFTDEMKQAILDLQYVEIAISSFTNNRNTVEMGSTVEEVVLSWSLNKVPTALKVDNAAVDVNAKTTTLTGQSIKANKTFTLSATDERDKTVTKTTSISFQNGVYWGVGAADAAIDSAFVLGLTKGLQASKAKTFTVNAGAGKHIYYAIPARYGTPTFNVGGFDGGFNKVATFDFTNASGYTESYDVYKSTNANLGNTTVKAS